MNPLKWLRPPAPLDEALRISIERTVVAVEPLLRTVGGYERRLAPVVRHALDYCGRLAADIPGPVEISRAAFAADPVVHALFASADDIQTMLARSQCVRDHLVGAALPVTGQCCALLGMRRREKSGYGVALAGDMVCADEPQRLLYFEGHALAEPAPDLDGARRRLGEAMFDGLLKSMAAHVADLRSAGNGPAPADLLSLLIECLAAPEAYLRLKPTTLTVDRAGIIRAAGDKEANADTLTFMELTSRDRRRWVVMLVRIEREEARRAVARLDEARRHIVI
jgi:hypothetical protein